MNDTAKEDTGQGDYESDEARSEETEGDKVLRQCLLSGKPATMHYMCSLQDEAGKYDPQSNLFAVKNGDRTFGYMCTPFKHGTSMYLLVLGGSVLGEVILTTDGE
jgi:hypothetical protein